MPSAPPTSAFDPGLTWPVISRSIGIGRWWLPGWSPFALIAFPATLTVAVGCLTCPTPPGALSSGLFEGMNTQILLGIGAMIAGIFIGILFLAQLRRERPPTLRCFPDRLEIARIGANTEIWCWAEIATQAKRATDVWIETEGTGRNSHSVICFQFAGKKARTRRLPLGLNPCGPAEPAYANRATLRRAMLLGMLYSQPTLRIDWDVYKCCEISPRTLRRQRWPKWFDYGLGCCTFCGVLALLCTDVAINATLVYPWLSIAAFVVSTIIVAMAGGLLYVAFAPDPETAANFGERHRRLMAWRASVAPLA